MFDQDWFLKTFLKLPEFSCQKNISFVNFGSWYRFVVPKRRGFFQGIQKNFQILSILKNTKVTSLLRFGSRELTCFSCSNLMFSSNFMILLERKWKFFSQHFLLLIWKSGIQIMFYNANKNCPILWNM